MSTKALKAAATQILKSPMAQQMGQQLVHEVLSYNYNLFKTYDDFIDRVAYQMALEVYKQEQENQNNE